MIKNDLENIICKFKGIYEDVECLLEDINESESASGVDSYKISCLLEKEFDKILKTLEEQKEKL